MTAFRMSAPPEVSFLTSLGGRAVAEERGTTFSSTSCTLQGIRFPVVPQKVDELRGGAPLIPSSTSVSERVEHAVRKRADNSAIKMAVRFKGPSQLLCIGNCRHPCPRKDGIPLQGLPRRPAPAFPW